MIFIVVLTILFQNFYSHGEESGIYNSASHMRLLVRAEIKLYQELKSLLSNSSNLVENGYDLLNEIEIKYPNHMLEVDVAENFDYSNDDSDEALFISHPINSYFIIKRFVYNWPYFLNNTEEHSKHFINLMENFDNKNNNHIIPNYNDYYATIDSIIRICEFTIITAEKVIEGDFNSKFTLPIKSKLEIDDILTIGKRAFLTYKYQQAIDWLNEAKKIISVSSDFNVYSDILDYSAWSYFKLGDIEKAVSLTKLMLEMGSKDPRITANYQYFLNYKPEKELQDMDPFAIFNKIPLEEIKKDPFKLSLLKKFLSNITLNGVYYRELQDRMTIHTCKYGNLFSNITVYNNEELYCTFKHGYFSNINMGPYKIEKIYHDPDVFIFHDFISDEEITVLKSLSSPKLARATVHNIITGKIETARYRVAKSSWHGEEEHPIIGKINKRLQDITGLVLDYSEALQVQNYGVGGYYDSHFDFATKEQIQKSSELDYSNGNRIATTLLYMNDIPVGGETGFTRLGIKVTPKKGNVLFWHNLFPDGTGDARTRHVACPVVLGTKWVSNRWIREKGQEVYQSCSKYENKGI